MKVAVIGTGALGFAIAKQLYQNGHEVTMWSESETKAAELQAGKLEILPQHKPIKEIIYTSSYQMALKDVKIVYLMVSTKYIADVCQGMLPFVTKDMHFCIGSKGIEQGSCRFVHQVFLDYIPTKKLSIISGPSFAIDIANNEPIAFALASKSATTSEIVIDTLANKSIKIRKSTDLIGIQLGGALKNVIAIASGIVAGLGYSEGTRAFFFVEAMHDIKELIHGLGGKKKTILSYACIGDLLMCCTSDKSRNFAYGVYLGKGDEEGAKKYLETTTVEGYYTLKSIYTLLRRKKIKMPVIDLIYKIVMKDGDPELLVKFLINKA